MNEMDSSQLFSSLNSTLDPVSTYAKSLAPLVIPFVVSLKNWGKTKEDDLENKLLDITVKFAKLQDTVFDKHIQLIFKWWFPQAAEVLTILHSTNDIEIDLSLVINSFCKNSTKAIYLLVGEYLMFSADAKLLDVNYDLSAHINLIENEVEEHTTTVRELLSSTFKQDKFRTLDSSGFSQFSEEVNKVNKTIVRVNSDHISLKRESSYTWSHTSTGDQSPRDHIETAFLPEEPVFVSFDI